jgi:type II secretory pathway pseudopilin PulG
MSLVELVVVLAMIGILLAIAAPFRGKATDQANDVVARANLRTVLLAQMEFYESNGRFTADRMELLAFAPGLPLGEQGTPRSIYMVVGQSKSFAAVCLFTQGGTGWHTLYHSGGSGSTEAPFGPKDCTRMMLDEQSGARTSGSHTQPTPSKASADSTGITSAVVRDTTTRD